MNGNENNTPIGGNDPSPFGAPPKPEVNVRTMQSDASSIARGEPMPVPESVLPPENSKEPVFKPETQFGDLPGTEGMAGLTPPPVKSHWWLWVLVVVAVIAVGVVGYFAYPMIFGSTPSAEPAPQPAPVPVPQVSPHTSFFLPAPSQRTEIRFDAISPTAITSGMKSIADVNKAFPIGTVQEIVFLDTAGSQIPWKTVFSSMVPSFGADKAGAEFEDDFTSFLFYGANGVFPGFVARVKTGVNLDEIKTDLAALESSDLTRFYLETPGAFMAWKSGQLNGKPTRYAQGATAGASLNYILSGSSLVISTSFEGLKAVAPLLGL